MFFSAYLGSPDQAWRWREALQRHAAWLELSAHIFSRNAADGRVFSFGWASLRPPDTNALVREDTGSLTIIPLDTLTRPQALTQEQPRGFETNAVRMDVSLTSGEVRIAVPVLTPEQFYWASRAGDWVFGNDLRCMARWAGLEFDDVAVYGLLRYGFIPPPLTLSRAVRRISPGHQFVLAPDSRTPSVDRFFESSELQYSDRDTSDADELLCEALDGVLSQVSLPALMHFSGGVDSGLMAARLAVMGRRDVWLQNFSEGPEDPFRKVAPEMAAHLGMPFCRVEWESSGISHILRVLACEYSFPFTDPATIPTMMLVHAISDCGDQPRSFLEGTGAGSILEWGLHYTAWRQIHLVPRPLRLVGAAMYRAGLWRHDARWVRPFAAMQTSVHIPLLHTMQTTLNGYAFRVPPNVGQDLEGVLAEGLMGASQGLEPRDWFSLLSLMRFGAHFSAARSFDPMRRRGVAPVFPFLEPAIIRAGFSLTWDQKFEGGMLKAPLKRLLARSVPREWVFWPKGVFVFPYQSAYTHPDVQALWADVVLSPRNRLLDYCRVDKVRNVLRYAEGGKVLHAGARRLLWTLTFVSAWLKGLDL